MTLWSFWTRSDEPFEVTSRATGDRGGSRLTGASPCCAETWSSGRASGSLARTLLDMAAKIPPRSLTRFVNDGRLRKILTLEALADITIRNPTARARSR